VTEEPVTDPPESISEESKRLALFIVLPLFLCCYGGSCIIYCVHKIIRNCARAQHGPPGPVEDPKPPRGQSVMHQVSWRTRSLQEVRVWLRGPVEDPKSHRGQSVVHQVPWRTGSLTEVRAWSTRSRGGSEASQSCAGRGRTAAGCWARCPRKKTDEWLQSGPGTVRIMTV